MTEDKVIQFNWVQIEFTLCTVYCIINIPKKNVIQIIWIQTELTSACVIQTFMQ